MVTTAKTHFNGDISRAFALHENAQALEISSGDVRLVGDMRGAGIAMAVGAMDAYFCDKYVDCLTKSLQAYSMGSWVGSLPSYFRQQKLPAGEIISNARRVRPRWSIRMAARAQMEKDNLYSLSRLDDMFNGILPNGQKLWLDFAQSLADLNRKRFTTLVASDLVGLNGEDLKRAQKRVFNSVKIRIGKTVQYRHDWIHNCARPKERVIDYTSGEAKVAMEEIKLLIELFETHIESNRLA